jgi:DNA-binding MarR family transcriptional regulator
MKTDVKDPKAVIEQLSRVFNVSDDPTGAAGPGSENVISEMGRTMHSFHRAFQNLTGMSGAQWRMMSLLLTQAEGVSQEALHEQMAEIAGSITSGFKGISQREIQERLAVDAAGITRVAKQLEQDGLIRRETDPRDNRFTLIYLTDAGRRLQEEMPRKVRELWQRAFKGMSNEEVTQMRDVLRHLADNLAEMGCDEQMN